jgi:uncharacterized protein YchJ
LKTVVNKKRRPARAAGIEPSDDFDATENRVSKCENYQECRAANALHEICLKSRYLAALDADLQFVIEAWASLGWSVRQAVTNYLLRTKCGR